MATKRAPNALIIPGLNGHPDMLVRAAPQLFPGWSISSFNHHADLADGGVGGLAERALRELQADDAPYFVCGESFGGTVALTLAHLAPERVRGLVLLSTFGWHPSMLARRGVGALALWSFLGGRVGDRVYRAGRIVSLPTQLGLRFSAELFQSYIQRPRAQIDAYRTKAELCLTFDARPWLGAIDTPAFVLAGSWDPVVPASAGRELARRLPNATLYTLSGGHLVHLVHAARVGQLISDWARHLR
jgi:pimeloyl-ACP methyl ester carboxylesterase